MIDFRRAMTSDDRFAHLSIAVADVKRELKAGARVHVIWPMDQDVLIAGSLLGVALARLLVSYASRSPEGELIIHSKSGVTSHWLSIPPTANVTLMVHVNSDEAAMRWERHDAAPGRRLAFVKRLREHDWTVQVCVGVVRFEVGWKDAYSDLFEQMSEAGICEAAVRFEGDDLLSICEKKPRTLTVATTGRREFLALMKRELCPSPARRRQASRSWFGMAA